MKTVTKVFIIIAICCVVIGSLIFSIGGAMIDFDFTEIGADNATYQLVTKDYSVAEFEELNLTVKNLIVKFEKSADEKIHLNFYESDSFENNYVQSKNTISMHRKQKSWFNFSINSEKNLVTIQLPKNYDPKMDLNVDNGGLEIADFTFSKPFDIEIDNGAFNLENSIFKADGEISVNNGVNNIENSTFNKNVDFYLRNTTNKINNSTFVGNTKFDNSNGNLRFDSVSFESVSAKSSNGNINFDRVNGNNFNLDLSNSNIRGEISENESDFTIFVSTSNGSSNIHDRTATTGNKKFVVKVNNGTINLSFIG